MILETIQVLVSFTTITNGTLIRFRSNVVIIIVQKITMTMLVMVFKTIGVLISFITASDRTFVRFISVGIYRKN